ncbi:hypothetical protein [Geminicoccus harenae]|uniref:hypothetical protein n=1 Tax=Geminicoccus harenae TaxID=2498453 RepID=UPI00168BBC00|nr:hypothetical protein [Geminicoccus harenae]
MLRNLMFGAAALALVAFASPAGAQLAPGDVEIEGPMTAINFADLPSPLPARYIVGTITVMGVKVNVWNDTLIHTPTKTSLDETDPLTFASFASGKLPGRSEEGFLGGTAIVIGDSAGEEVHATDLFSDLAENVIVGEATELVTLPSGVSRATVNGMPIRRSTDSRMPAGPAINSFGLRVNEREITPRSLVSAEGYYSSRQKVLYYHTLEADGAPLLNKNRTQVGILRADCRIRGGGRDEIEVRGGVVNPANATVQIRIPALNNPDRWTTVGFVTATAQPAPVAGDPDQGLFRADLRNLTIPGGVCPSRVRAVVPAGAGVPNAATATADMDGR